MPKTYATSRKREALDLLSTYDQVSTVQHLTGIPYSTLYRWRKAEFSKDSRLSEKKDFAFSDNFSQNSDSSPEPESSLINNEEVPAYLEAKYLAELADTPVTEDHSQDEEPVRGVPGKTYPYPIEEDVDPNSR